MQTFITKKKNLVVALFVFWSSLAFAQPKIGFQKDPYKKPGIWKMLKRMPNNVRLWSEYVGKPVGKLTEIDKQNIRNWRILLKQRRYSPTGGPTTSRRYTPTSRRSSYGNKTVIAAKDQKYLKDIVTVIMLENPEIMELKKNVQANFLLIEDKFNDMFLNLGMEYKYYDEIHPYGNYAEIRWVEEMERKIKTARLKEVRRVRNRYIIQGR